MEITISDEHVVKRLKELATERNQTPEQIIADAIEQFSPSPQQENKTFWNAIQGIGASGDPDLAHRIKRIVRDEVDPIEGWNKPGDAQDSD